MKKRWIIIGVIFIILILLVIILIQTGTINEKAELLEQEQLENQIEKDGLKSSLIEYEEEVDRLKSINNELTDESEVVTSDLDTYEREIEDLNNQIDGLLNSSEYQANEYDSLVFFLESLDFYLVKDNLPSLWNNVWSDLFESEGEIDESQVEIINYLLRPYYQYEEWGQVNPLSGFFYSIYENTRDIDFSSFLSYCPYGVVSDTVPEYEELKRHELWPFHEDVTLENIPTPIRRYSSDIIDNIFETYAGIGLSELSEESMESALYLESTDSYYNFTSDFGPGIFTCEGGMVYEDRIELYGEALISDGRVILTIVKADDKFIIESFVEE